MGYYTSYNLEVIEGDKDLIFELRNSDEDAEYAINKNGDCENDCKWDEHELDLKKFSKDHPSAVLKLSGYGEEKGDIWCEYYQNGKMHRYEAKIVFGDFKPELLR